MPHTLATFSSLVTPFSFFTLFLSAVGNIQVCYKWSEEQQKKMEVSHLSVGWRILESAKIHILGQWAEGSVLKKLRWCHLAVFVSMWLLPLTGQEEAFGTYFNVCLRYSYQPYIVLLLILAFVYGKWKWFSIWATNIYFPFKNICIKKRFREIY